ncbi:SGNH/GDSL hydrolase family protein [Frondihabitans cladoniiphilus]|uniref:SGNH hydrolase-type esterase domain-containing protein n=1 Tax=Frondihabitans cladoniiphilus TaxID=715785 RepID=A0ABP8VRK1_9MICO
MTTRRRGPFRVLLLAGTVAGSLALLVGCSTSVTAATPTSTSSPSSSSASSIPIRFAAVGDSLTSGITGANIAEGENSGSWVHYALGGRLEFAGGWSVPGTTIEEQAAHVAKMSDVDVLVVLSGTNDVRHGETFGHAEASYADVVATTDPERVLIAAIPPLTAAPDAAREYNTRLAAFATAHGWTFFDPWGFARDGDDWKAGVSTDGIHPTLAGYERLGASLRSEILRVGASG